MSGRRLGAALAVGVLIALAVDLLLQAALDAVRIQASRVNWETAVASKAVWLVAVSIGGAIAPRILSPAARPMSWRDAFHIAGVVLMAAPLIWTLATLVVFAARVPLTQPSFYAEIVTSIGPWMLAGAALRASARHLVG